MSDSQNITIPIELLIENGAFDIEAMAKKIEENQNMYIHPRIPKCSNLTIREQAELIILLSEAIQPVYTCNKFDLVKPLILTPEETRFVNDT